MHPILTHTGRLLAYLAAWIPCAGLLAVLAASSTDLSWIAAVVLTLPLAVIYAFICLAAWYPCSATLPDRTPPPRLVSTQLLAALSSSSVWLLLGAAWAALLQRLPWFGGIDEEFRRLFPILFAVGILLYVLAAAVHYLFLAFEASRRAESRALELQIRAREAELTALRAQREQELAERELELARSIQRRLLPPGEIEGRGYRIAARNLPAHYVAGDFFDVFPLADGAVCLAVADVAGKGIGASLIMASVKAVLPLIAAQSSLVGTLRELNRRLAADLAEREFVALALARFDPRDGRFELANSGLPDPYLLRPNELPREISVTGPRYPLGIRPRIEYQSVEATLEPGDRLLLYTDGLPEARDLSGDPLGYTRLSELLSHDNPTPAGWLDELLERLSAITQPPLEDDVTALVLERRQ